MSDLLSIFMGDNTLNEKNNERSKTKDKASFQTTSEKN